LDRIQATVTRTVGDWTRTKAIPTFYLLPEVQGILDEAHALRVAVAILNPTDDPQIEVSASAYFVELNPNS